MSKMRFTEFPALSVGYFSVYILPMTLKNIILSLVISFIFDISRRITTFSERHSVIFVLVKNNVTSEI